MLLLLQQREELEKLEEQLASATETAEQLGAVLSFALLRFLLLLIASVIILPVPPGEIHMVLSSIFTPQIIFFFFFVNVADAAFNSESAVAKQYILEGQVQRCRQAACIRC